MFIEIFFLYLSTLSFSFLIAKPLPFLFFFFFNDPAPTEISPLPLPAALPICAGAAQGTAPALGGAARGRGPGGAGAAPPVQPRSGQQPRCLDLPPGGRPGARGASGDRKSTRLNSSHLVISYAVFCLKKNTRKNGTTIAVSSRVASRVPVRKPARRSWRRLMRPMSPTVVVSVCGRITAGPARSTDASI